MFTLLNLKQNPNTSTIANTPLTTIQHSLLQRNETCGTRLPVSPVHWLSAWPYHQHMQKSSDQVRVSAPGGTRIPCGMTQLDVLVWHLHMAPEVEEVLPVSEHPDPRFPLPTLHLPCRASELWEGTTAMGSTTARQKGKSSSTEGEQYSQKQHFGEPDTSASCSLLRTT